MTVTIEKFLAMSQSLHLTGMNTIGLLAGSGVQPDRHLPCSGMNGRSLSYPYPSGVDCRLHPNVTIGALKFACETANFVCKARRKPDFPNQSGHGSYSQNRNRQNEWEENSQNFEDVDILSSKNGPLLSESKTRKFQPPPSPGPREREIVELFRKVRLQLQQHAANKEDNKIEVNQKQGSTGDPMDSIFQLLRNHTVDESKRRNRSDKGKGFPKEAKKNVQRNREPSTNPYGSDSSVKDEAQKAKLLSPSRPASNFQRRSPVTRVKYQSFPSDEGIANSISPPDTGERNMERNEDQTSEDSDTQAVPNPITNVDAEQYDLVHHQDLRGIKMPELRAIAKSRGLKGVSKMKKSALLELLGGSSD